MRCIELAATPLDAGLDWSPSDQQNRRGVIFVEVVLFAWLLSTRRAEFPNMACKLPNLRRQHRNHMTYASATYCWRHPGCVLL